LILEFDITASFGIAAYIGSVVVMNGNTKQGVKKHQ
jgi:hypothetical protein